MFSKGVTKSCRLYSSLTNSALVCEPKCKGRGLARVLLSRVSDICMVIGHLSSRRGLLTPPVNTVLRILTQ
jgi:hypothetical protein